MKPILMIALVGASLAAGAAGGFAVLELNKAPAPVVGQVEVAEGTDHSADVARQDENIGAMNRRINELETRLATAEKKSSEYDALKAKYEDNNKRLVKLEENRGSATVDSGTGTGGGEASSDPDTVRSQVRAELEAIEQEKQKAEQERREKQAQEWATAQNKAIIDRLVKDLNLTTDQQAKIEAHVATYQTNQRDLWTRAGQAREAGQEFDWRAESQKVETAAQESIRAELLGGQLETFNNLVSERGLNSLGGRGFGMGGQRGGGQRGGGRGGND